MPPRAIHVVCELQPVSVQHPVERHLHCTEENKPDSFLDQVTFSTVLDDGLLKRGKEGIAHFSDIFAAGERDLGHTTVFKHQIHLDNETPFKPRHRRIAPSMIEEVREHPQQFSYWHVA